MYNKMPIFFLLLMVMLAFTSTSLFARKNSTATNETINTTLDANEQTHLVFMREEEKLARDVYTMLVAYIRNLRYSAASMILNKDIRMQ